MDTELGGARPSAGQCHHPSALVEPGHLRSAADQLASVMTGAACGIQHPLAGYVAEQCQACGPVIEGVVKPVLGVHGELIGEYLVLRRADRPVLHNAILSGA